MNNKSFRFKPIETRYKGYRFRSRLEARWAVFFDALGIEFQYEPEGYALDGVAYLPDFFLPQKDWFVEIKGEAPTEQEIDKAKRLALYTQKYVYIFSGNICLPPNDMCTNITLVSPASLYQTRLLFDTYHTLIERQTRKITVSTEALALLQKLHDADIKAYSSVGTVALALNLACETIEDGDMEALFESMNNQRTVLKEITPLLRKHESELVQVLEEEDGWKNEFNGQGIIDELMWMQCPHCHSFDLGVDGSYHYECQQIELDANTSRLIAAYTAAREARF